VFTALPVRSVTSPWEMTRRGPGRCSSRGRLESVASAAGIVRAARRSGMRGTVTARRVFAGAERGDTLCRSIVAEEAILVSRAIASVTAVVDPALVVLGGGIGHVPYFVEERSVSCANS